MFEVRVEDVYLIEVVQVFEGEKLEDVFEVSVCVAADQSVYVDD